MKQKPRVAIIREAECIGCTKCIDVCPVDAILGSSKQMHTVIASECIGCKLCLPPCPVDCIDLVATPNETFDPDHVRQRYQARKERLIKTATVTQVMDDRKAYIQAAIERVKNKKTAVY
jgi:electron transport complex protein RnfB